jgi:hypothetical protein
MSINKTKKELYEQVKSMIGTKPPVSDSFQSRKRDNGQFGRRLEESLGVRENNSKNADVTCLDGDVELKTHNTKKGSKISILTKKPDWNKSEGFANIDETMIKYPSSIKQGVRRCNLTMTTTPNNKGLFLKIDEDDKQVKIIDPNQVTVCSWTFDTLKEVFGDKIGDTVILVSHKDKVVMGAEMYLGGDFENMKQMLKDGTGCIEFRATGAPKRHNRGIAFRCSKKNFIKLFNGGVVV